MEGEVYTFICVCMIIFVSIFSCHTIIGKNIPQGKTRLLSLTPIIFLFLLLPLNLTTLCLVGFTSFFITWLASFKLLLFAFGKGPLSNPSNTNLPIPLSQFVPLACFPIKITNIPSTQNSKQPSKKALITSPLKYATKVMLISILSMVNITKKYIHPHLKMSCYCLHIYFTLDLVLAMVAAVIKTLVRVELEPQFDKPHMATSVQNFWGKRWNLMVSSILRPTVYNPIRSISTSLMVIPKKWASLPAIFATFLMSGIMHELIFYYLGRLRPTGEVTCFFILQGVMVDIEIVIKKTLNGKFGLHPYVSRSLSLGFVIGSSFWLFFPPFLRMNPEVRECQEISSVLNFVRHGKLISPYDVPCPFDL